MVRAFGNDARSQQEVKHTLLEQEEQSTVQDRQQSTRHENGHSQEGSDDGEQLQSTMIRIE